MIDLTETYRKRADDYQAQNANLSRKLIEQQERMQALEAEIERLRQVGKQLLAIDMTLLEDLSPGAIEQFIRDYWESAKEPAP